MDRLSDLRARYFTPAAVIPVEKAFGGLLKRAAMAAPSLGETVNPSDVAHVFPSCPKRAPLAMFLVPTS